MTPQPANREASPSPASSIESRSTPDGQQHRRGFRAPLRPLDPMVLPDHIDVLYRAAWALCGSRHEAEDLVQDTFARVLKRPRLLRSDNDVGYLLRALRNTHATRHRAARRRPITVPLLETDSNDGAEVVASIDARELMAAIAAAPQPYRDAVVAVDVVGLSYRQAARHLRTREATITSRLSRGRQHVARALGEPASAHRGRRARDADRVSVLVPEWSLLVTGRSGMPPRIATIEYLVEVAKDWTLARFAAAREQRVRTRSPSLRTARCRRSAARPRARLPRGGISLRRDSASADTDRLVTQHGRDLAR